MMIVRGKKHIRCEVELVRNNTYLQTDAISFEYFGLI